MSPSPVVSAPKEDEIKKLKNNYLSSPKPKTQIQGTGADTMCYLESHGPPPHPTHP